MNAWNMVNGVCIEGILGMHFCAETVMLYSEDNRIFLW